MALTEIPVHRPIAAARAAVESHSVATRWILGGPVAVLWALATMMAMPLWMPAGDAGINDVALPILLSPLLWAVPFLYACLTEDLWRCSLILGGSAIVQAVAVAIRLAA